MSAKKINLVGFYHSEHSRPGWDGSSTLTIHGKTPGGKQVQVVVTASATSLGYLGRQVQKALDAHAANVEEAKRRASGADDAD